MLSSAFTSLDKWIEDFFLLVLLGVFIVYMMLFVSVYVCTKVNMKVVLRICLLIVSWLGVRLVTHKNTHTHFILPVFTQVLDYDKQKR